MGLSEDGEDAVESQFEELCLDLNMDKKAKDEAYENYQKIIENYSLEACFNKKLIVIISILFYPVVAVRESCHSLLYFVKSMCVMRTER